MDKESSAYLDLKGWIETSQARTLIASALPQSLKPDLWMQMALDYVRTSRECAKCDPLSVRGCVMTTASFGLRLDGVTGHAYIRALPIKDRGKTVAYVAQFQIGYKGMVDLAYRSNPDIQEVEPLIVYKQDNFSFQKGSQAFLHHTWPLGVKRGEMIAVYSGVRFKSGYYSFQIFDIADVWALRKSILEQSWIREEETTEGKRYLKKEYNRDWAPMPEYEAVHYPWIGHVVPMVLKTAIRWSQKFLPLVGGELGRAVSLVEQDDAGVYQGMAEVGQGGDVKTAPLPEVKGSLRKKMMEQAVANTETPVDEKPTAVTNNGKPPSMKEQQEEWEKEQQSKFTFGQE